MSGIPQTSYGTPIVLMNMFRGEVQPAFAGCGDDPESGVRWAGPRLELAWSPGDANPKALEWSFVEWIYFAGGMVHPLEGQFGDVIDYEILAPASPATSSPGAGAYGKQEIIPGSGIHRFAPQAGGGWDLDLAAKLNDSVRFTSVVPVPSRTGTGYFNWDSDSDGVTSAPDGDGAFDLLDAQVTLANYAPRFRVSGSQWVTLVIPGVKPRRLLPHWKHRLKWTVTGGTVERKLEWALFIARETT